jgi:beta-N-acetylhexosaminidase
MTRRDLLPLFCFGFDGIDAPEHLQTLVAQGLGGIILFKRNLHDLEQICRLTADLHRTASGPLLIGVDQEGGRVTRLPPPFLVPPAAAQVGHLDDPRLTEELAYIVGCELRVAGFNWNLAPVLDVHTNPKNPVIGDRAYSEDAARVARMGLAAMRGFQRAGILATAKHFPGHGDTAADSHLTLPESFQTAERLRSVEWVPFKEAITAHVPSILVAHLACHVLDPVAPTSLSPVVIREILRGELGFQGVVVSDDLEMGAIVARYDVGEAAVRFLEAGGDLILVCHDPQRQLDALAAVERALQTRRLFQEQIEASLTRLANLQREGLRANELPNPTSAREMIGSTRHQLFLELLRDRIAAK